MKSLITLAGLMCFAADAQNAVYDVSQQPITLLNNQILLNATVDDQTVAVILDTGISKSTLVESAISKTANKQIRNTVFSGNCRLATTGSANYNCGENFSGRVGYDLLRTSRQVYLVDFDASIMIRRDNFRVDDAKGYQEIKSDFRSDGLYIQIMLKWKTFDLKFDTGYSGAISFSPKDASLFIKERCKSYQSENGAFSVYPNKWITVNDRYYNALVAVPERGHSRIGTGFLKGFNWIIDFRQQKVYFKKNGISLDSENVFPPDYVARAQNGRLTIVSANANGTRFRLGDVIENVNNVQVTPENLCQMQSFLQTARNWEIVEIRARENK